MAGNSMERIFLLLNQGMSRLANIVKTLADDIVQLESIGGGGGSASIEDYESNKTYKRNTLLVDADTETMYRVCCETEYTSVTVDDDRRAGNLKQYIQHLHHHIQLLKEIILSTQQTTIHDVFFYQRR